jgi:hypothetical protein
MTNALDGSGVAAAMAVTERLIQPVLVRAKTDDSEALILAFPGTERTLDLAPYLDVERERREKAPERVWGTAKADTLDSFIELVKRHRVTGESVIFASQVGPSLRAVLNYHAPSESRVEESCAVGAFPLKPAGLPKAVGHCDHCVDYRFEFAPIFRQWRDAMRIVPQREFSEFLQKHVYELMDPEDATEENEDGSLKTPSPESVTYMVMMKSVNRYARATVRPRQVFAAPGDLMKLAAALQASCRQTWAEVASDEWGNMSLSVTDEKQAIVPDQKLGAVPKLFLISLEVFPGAGFQTLPARLKVEVKDGKLYLGAELIGVERLLESAFLAALERVTRETECPVYRGSMEE